MPTPISESSIKAVWENNPDTPITTTNLSKSCNFTSSYRDFLLTPAPHRQYSILMLMPGSTLNLLLKRDSVFSIINTAEKSGEPVLNANEFYRMFDTGLEDLILTTDNMDSTSGNPTGNWGANQEWFVYICDKFDSTLEKQSSDDYGGGAQILISRGLNYPTGVVPGDTERNYSEADTRKIGGFKSNASGQIIESSIWDISGKYYNVKSKKYYILDEYTADPEDTYGRHLFRQIRLVDLDTSVESNFNYNVSIKGDFQVKDSTETNTLTINPTTTDFNITTGTALDITSPIITVTGSTSVNINTPTFALTRASTSITANTLSLNSTSLHVISPTISVDSTTSIGITTTTCTINGSLIINGSPTITGNPIVTGNTILYGALNMNNTLTVTNNISGYGLSGKTLSLSGDGTSSNAGSISFGSNPGGGSGHTASMIHKTYSGANTRLEILGGTNSADYILLQAEGGIVIGKVGATSGSLKYYASAPTLTGTAILGYNGYFYVSRLYTVGADLAEYFLSKDEKIPGRIYSLYKEKNVRLSNKRADSRVVGICSENPGFVMHSEYEQFGGVPLVLSGTIPVCVKSIIKEGDELVADINGYAVRANWFDKIFNRSAIIGKALEASGDNNEKKIVILC